MNFQNQFLYVGIYSKTSYLFHLNLFQNFLINFKFNLFFVNNFLIILLIINVNKKDLIS